MRRLLPMSLLMACQEPAPTWHQDVRPLVEARCGSCHTAGGVAPFALDTYEQAAPMGALAVATVEAGLMPPWGAADVRAYANDPSLTPAQIAVMRAWVDAGMPEGDPAEPGEPLQVVAHALPSVDAVLEMAEPYVPTGAPDDYRCFVLDWPEAETTFVTGFHPQPGNPELVHHIAAFLFRPDTLAGPGVFDTLAEWEAEDDAPGYTCFGGPGGSSDLQVPVQQLAQWVPGGGAVVLPEGTGIEVPAGSKVVLQVHYFVKEAGQSDRTSIALSLAPTVERKGGFGPWLDALWPLGSMTIPAGAEVTHEREGDPRQFWTLMTGDLDLSQGFVVHSAMLHMHLRGASAETWIDRADGTRVPLLELPAYDFDWQLSYQLAEPVQFNDGDSLGVRCTFDNTDGSEDVSWGEGTTDEMCVANLFVSEP